MSSGLNYTSVVVLYQYRPVHQLYFRLVLHAGQW